MPRLPRLGRKIWDGYTAFAILALAFCLSFPIRRHLLSPNAPQRDATTAGADSVVPLWRRPDSLFVNTASPRLFDIFAFNRTETAWIIYFRDRGVDYESVSQLDTLIPALDHDHLHNIAHLISFRQRRRKTSRPHSFTDSRHTDSPKRQKRVPLFLADSVQMSAAGISPAAWDTLARFQATYILAGSMTIDSLVRCSPAELASRLQPHVRSARRTQSPPDHVAPPPAPEHVNLNTATPEQLVAIPGIGEATARRIVELRVKLGGFVSPDQLQGSCRITPDNFLSMRQFLYADSSAVVPVNVNSSNDTRMRRHPYFPQLLVSRIWQLKQQKRGGRLSKEDIQYCIDGIDVSPFFWHYVTY